MTSFGLDMYQTAAAGVLSLLLGDFLNRKIPILKRICIPAPVTGGIIFSLLTLLLHSTAGLEISFDGTVKDICMTMFFTTVGFQADFTVFRKGGRLLGILVGVVAILIVMQDLIGTGLASALGLNPIVGMAAGSITMTGGHGTAAGFTSLVESRGLDGAGSILMAAATFGLLAGSIAGGPLAERIIRKKGLHVDASHKSPEALEFPRHIPSAGGFVKAVFSIAIAMGVGSVFNRLLALTGISFPTYLGPLLTAALARNFSEFVPGCPKFRMDEILSIGNVCLSLFLGIAMISLRLWELAGLALPLLCILIAQVLFIVLFARYAAFPLLGRDYDAAVIVSGICGFGLGATPNAMANMSAVCSKHSYARTPFLVVPIVGAMFVDIINILVITLFINLI